MSRFSFKELKVRFDSNALLVYCIMFFSNDTYLFGTNSTSWVLSFARYMLILICGVILFKMKLKLNIFAHRKKVIAYIIIISLFVTVAFVNQELLNRTIIKVLCITVAFLLCMALRFDEYVSAFRKAMYFISLCAISFTALAYVVPGIVRSFPSVINTAGVRFYTCFLTGLDSRFIGTLAIRTGGPFWEPGVYHMYINMAIAYELLLRKKPNKKYLIAQCIALVLTFSTTGYAVFAWIMIGYGFFKNDADMSSKRVFRFSMAMVIFMVGFIILQYTPIGDVVLGKIINPEPGGTAMVRLAGVITNIEIALQNPLHGIGMQSMEDEFLRVSMASDLINGWTHHNTNTLLYQFSAHGIPYGLLFTIGTFKFGNHFNNGKKIITVVIFIMMVLMYVGENLQYSSLPYMLVFYGYGWKDQSEKSSIMRRETAECRLM